MKVLHSRAREADQMRRKTEHQSQKQEPNKKKDYSQTKMGTEGRVKPND